MKFVRCDKCGKTRQICLVDSDYIVLDDNGEIENDCCYENSNSIIERKIGGKTFDICGACYSSLQEIKEKAENEFLNSLATQKECGYGRKTDD